MTHSNATRISWPTFDWTDPHVLHVISGATAGGATAGFVCPLDVLKTRIQVQSASNARYTGIVSGLSRLLREEGVRAAYRGLTPTLLALLPSWAVYFSSYEYLKSRIRSGPLGSRLSSTAQYILASASAGAINVVVTNPLWVVKTRLQTQDLTLQYGTAVPRRFKGTFDVLHDIVRTQGVQGLYSGLLPSLMGIAHVAIQFPLYENLKAGACAWRRVQERDLPTTDLVLASALSKIIASTATYPHEVIRSHMHVMGSGAFAGFRSIVLRIMREEGLRGFYRGCLTNLVRTTPAAAITFTTYELIYRKLCALAERRKAKRGAVDSGPTPADAPAVACSSMPSIAIAPPDDDASA